MNRYAMYDNVMMCLEPKDIASTATAAAYVSLKAAHKVSFLVIFGAVTSDSADTEVITVECATAEGGTEATVAFNYRLAGALGANTWGAVTTCASTGLAITPDDDNKMVWIEIDPEQYLQTDYTVARVKLTDTTDMAACLVSVLAIVEPRYRLTTMKSSTASASS